MNAIVVLDKLAMQKLDMGAQKALILTGQHLRGEAIKAQVIPFREGTLQNISTEVDISQVEKGQLKIVHKTPYAHKLYIHPEYTFNKVKNANAQGMWWERWIVGAKKDEARKFFIAYLKLKSGGTVT